MPNGKNSPSKAILEAVKTLVIAYGPREAARQLELPANTVKSWAFRYGWKEAKPVGLDQPTSAPGKQAQSSLQTNGSTVDTEGSKRAHPKRTHVFKSPSEALESAILSHKSRSTLALGKYTAEASERAAKSDGNLLIARQVRDVAAIHSTLYPAERTTNLLAIGILTGSVEVTDEPEAIDCQSTALPSIEPEC